jgi:large subunit ribosomal protein L10
VLRAEKAEVVDQLHAAFADASVVVVTHYKGLSVPEVTELRTAMRQAGASFRVAKNRLVKRAIQGTPYESLSDLLTGPTAFAFSADPVAAPKVASTFARRNEKLQIVGGGLGATVLDAAAVKALAELPSLDEVRGKLIAAASPGRAGRALPGAARRAGRRLTSSGNNRARLRALQADCGWSRVQWRILSSWSMICRS